MKVSHDIKLDFDDVLLRPKRSTLASRKDVDLIRHFEFNNSGDVNKMVPIFAANMDGVGTLSMAKALGDDFMMGTVLRKGIQLSDVNSFEKRVGEINFNYVSLCVGSNFINDKNDIDFLAFEEIYEGKNLKKTSAMLTIDVANGYHRNFTDAIKIVREKYPRLTIIAGNVATPEMVEELILQGADMVKIGLGNGASCLTRIMTGVGVPQLSCVMECADAANGIGGLVMSDGGCVHPGDVSKAFAAGAHAVMLGSMLAGHDESEVEVDENGNVVFYGMSSAHARRKKNLGGDSYRGSEGRVVKMPYKGAVYETVKNLLGGIRSTCTYIGARRIKDMPRCASFIRVNNVINKSLEAKTIG